MHKRNNGLVYVNSFYCCLVYNE